MLHKVSAHDLAARMKAYAAEDIPRRHSAVITTAAGGPLWIILNCEWLALANQLIQCYPTVSLKFHRCGGRRGLICCCHTDSPYHRKTTGPMLEQLRPGCKFLFGNLLRFRRLSRMSNFVQVDALFSIGRGAWGLAGDSHVAESDAPALALEADEAGIRISVVRFAPICVSVVESGHQRAVQPNLIGLADDLDLILIPGAQAQWNRTVVLLNSNATGRCGNVVDGPSAVLISSVSPCNVINLHFESRIDSDPGLVVVWEQDAWVKAVRDWKTRIAKTDEDAGVVVRRGQLKLQTQGEITERTREIAQSNLTAAWLRYHGAVNEGKSSASGLQPFGERGIRAIKDVLKRVFQNIGFVVD